jgi:hypothetical protein
LPQAQALSTPAYRKRDILIGMRALISNERITFKFQIGRQLASSLAGFIAGVVGASILWSIAWYVIQAKDIAF